eukprot:387720-Pelagomonas_calceolata.AAC.1
MRVMCCLDIRNQQHTSSWVPESSHSRDVPEGNSLPEGKLKPDTGYPRGVTVLPGLRARTSHHTPWREW